MNLWPGFSRSYWVGLARCHWNLGARDSFRACLQKAREARTA